MNTECASQIQEAQNKEIYSRNIPSQPLQPYIDVRPVMTKYSYFPIVDPRREIGLKLQQQPTFDTQTVFNPGNTQSPWSGFASNINTESELRNQIYALQKCSQAVYVPNSTSDLYTYSFRPNNQNHQAHSLLFQEETFDKFNPNPNDKQIGSGLFMNSTRTQLRSKN